MKQLSTAAAPLLSNAVLHSPHPWWGTFCGLFSAVVYTVANGFLRAVTDSDPIWVSAMKALSTAACLAPWLVLSLRRGDGFPPVKIWLMIAASSLVGQLGGNISFQYALGQIGLALTVPLSLGGMIVGATVLSRLFLHERVSVASAIAVGILLMAIAVLSLGAEEARAMVLQKVSANHWQLTLGVTTACLSGVAYSVLNVVIRHAVQRGATLPATLMTVSMVGLIALGMLALRKIGVAGMLQTAQLDLVWMLAAGVCNAAAFVALTRCLQLTSVVYANVLNAAQAALAALAGVLVFNEPASVALTAGVGLTILGLTVLTRGKR
ncbi:EamA-like transporter family protein [Anatilimnocola aggregata]|uniref:EamA-like transporter family protein n=1 Tax=Anatilimnocola aggregata TaxID=2528021 RepID=A0A517YB98_9BACT|nr:EamA family transporter [Anatilimnocola aggregata]QDU27520.1 EamA-like transporter family protein [Anatilimnocola aggregata]